MKRTIYCPGPEKRLTLGQYVKVVQTAKANLDVTYREGLTTWWPTTGREIVKQYWQGVEDRINQGIPYSERGK